MEGKERGIRTVCRRGRRSWQCTYHWPSSVFNVGGLSEKERQSCIAPDADSLLHRTSYRRSVCSDLAGYQPWRTVPHSATQYAIQRAKAQDRDRCYQTQESPHRGLLRHSGRYSQKGKDGTAQEPLQVWRTLSPQLLQRGKRKRPYLLWSLQPAKNGGSTWRIQGNILCLPETWRSIRVTEYGWCYDKVGKKETGRVWRFPFSYAETHIHQQSALQRCSTKGCAGTARTRWRKYHNEHLRSL